MAIIEASREALKNWGIRKTQMYEICVKKVLEAKLTESPVRSAKHVSGLPKKQVELDGHLFLCIAMRSLHGLAPTRMTDLTRIPEILPTTKNSVVLVVDCTWLTYCINSSKIVLRARLGCAAD